MTRLYPMDVHISIFVLHYIDSLIPFNLSLSDSFLCHGHGLWFVQRT